MKTYRGWRLFAGTRRNGTIESEQHDASGVRVVVLDDGVERDLPLCLDVWNHSPDGFNWGYCGSGPTQLALAILCDCLGRDAALPLYQEFKRRHVASWGNAWRIDEPTIRAFAREFAR